MSQRGDREIRAQEALIVSRLLPPCANDVQPSSLRALTESECSKLACLRPGFIDELIGRIETEEQSAGPGELEGTDRHRALDRELVHGMNRARGVSETAAEEIIRKREQILDQLCRERDERRDRDNC
jgi:hypothetical protein